MPSKLTLTQMICKTWQNQCYLVMSCHVLSAQDKFGLEGEAHTVFNSVCGDHSANVKSITV